MEKQLTESFEWTRGISGLPKTRLLKAIAKTTRPTIHPEDPTFPVRLFAEVELMKNARSLIGRPVGLNHSQMPIFGAYAVDADWNELQKQLEALLFVPEEYIRKVAEGKIKNVSIEYTWRDTKQTDAGTEFMGLGITRVDLVEGLDAGDPNAIVSLFEATEKRGIVLAEITPPQVAEVPPVAPSPPPEVPKTAELEAAITKMSGTIAEMEKSRASAIEDARKSAKQEVADKVNAAMPNNLMRNPLAIRIIRNVRDAVRDECGPDK